MWVSSFIQDRKNHILNLFYGGYMASDIWLRTILIVREETRCHYIGYSFRLAARVLLYAPSHRQDNTYMAFVTPVAGPPWRRSISQKEDLSENCFDNCFVIYSCLGRILNALDTFYGVVKDHSDSEKGNLLPPHGLLFPISSKRSFICIIPHTGLHIPQPLLHKSWSTGWYETIVNNV